jgi:methyl-accepting chemotaxis protein
VNIITKILLTTITSISIIIGSFIQSVNTLLSENARSVEEIASASEHLNKMTEQLQELKVLVLVLLLKQIELILLKKLYK